MIPSRRIRAFAPAAAIAAVLAAPAAAQIPGLTPTPAPAAEAPGDPYGRETPYGAFLGLMRASTRENWALAAEFLKWPAGAKPSPEEIAKELKAVLDERFEGDLDKLSRAPTGDLNDGLGPEYEKAGTVSRGEDSFDVLLVRVTKPEGPAIWLVAPQTLREIPAAFRDLSAPELDAKMPELLKRRVHGSLRVWQLLAFWLLAPAAWALGRLVAGALARVGRRVAAKRSASGTEAAGFDRFVAPLALLLAVPLHALVVSRIGLPLLSRFGASRLWRLTAVAAVTWLFIRTIAFFTSRATLRLAASGATAASSLTIGRRVLQGLALLGGVLTALGLLGVNLTATLAGLGIGGLAVAFAAQKSLENFFGGAVVLSDKVLKVGDVVKIGAVLGEVEDVTLYAARIRTIERSVVSIPNGVMMTSQIENLSRRDKFLFRHTLGLRYETGAAQMAAALDGLRGVLAREPIVEPSSARVRFLRLNAYTLDVEVWAYLLVPGWPEFLEAQERLLLALMRAVEEAGTGFAFPTQTTYLAGEAAALQPGGSPRARA